MDMTIDQQVALDEAMVLYASRLMIRKSNFGLKSDISSKELTLQLVYAVMRLTPLFKAFFIIANVPEIYMQELWATATVYHHSIRFKIDNKKHIVNLEYFREMLHICPRLPGQTFDELSFEKEILAFLRFLGHSGEIRRFTDVNINKLHQPWRSFAAIIKKCLSGKSSGYDSLRLSQARILWGLYHKRNVDFAYLPREDFVYQVEHKDAKKSDEIYYPRDDQMFITIKLEYYAVATRATPPKTKASVQKTKSSFDTTVTPPLTAAAGIRMSTSAKGKQLAKASKAKRDDDDDEGSNDQDDDDAQDDDDDQDDKNKDDDDQDKGDMMMIKRKESFDPITKMPKNMDDKGNDEENLGLNVGIEEGQDEEDDEGELYRDVNINLEGRVVQIADVHTTQEFKDSHVTPTPVNPDGQQQSSSVSSQFVTSMLNPTPNVGIDSIFETSSQMDVQAPTTVAPLSLSAPTLTPLTIATISTVPQAPTPLKTTPSTLVQHLPNFSSLFGFDHRLKTLKANFSEFMQTNQFAGAVSSIPRIVQRYMDQRMNEAVKIIKEQVKEQVKVQVSKILPKIKQTVNEQLEAEVLTWSSNSSKTSYAVAADLSEMELKKILIKKMEGNKSIHRSNEQRNLYKALVEGYESDKIILDTYGDIVTLKRRRDDDADKDEEPSAGSDRGSK
nr:hypothetical protein [Tanacetum cinerariifolium]